MKHKVLQLRFFRQSLFLLIATIGINLSLIAQSSDKLERLPREVWVASISQAKISAETSEEMISKVLEVMEEIVPKKPDIIVLPEVFPFSGISKKILLKSEAVDKITELALSQFSIFAKKNNCYIICSTYTKEGGKLYNSSVLIDRQGKVIGEYRKMYPTSSELEMGICPGPSDPPVFDTDFGKIGIQICYDINWMEGWTALKKKGAEIVFWPSAYGGGEKLNSYAQLLNYYVVSSTRKNPSKIISITGEDIAVTGFWNTNWVCAPINLEKEIISVWPSSKKYNAIEEKYGRKIKITTFHNEGISIIESLSADIKIKNILAEFDIKPLREAINKAEIMKQKALLK